MNTTETRQATCKERIAKEFRSTMTDIRRMWDNEHKDESERDPNVTPFNEYGLSFDYVAPGTFQGQRRGYFRYQLSWGGPSDEFRYFVDERLKPTRVEYWFMDWFDGAKRILRGDDLALMEEIFEDFTDLGMVRVNEDEA